MSQEKQIESRQRVVSIDATRKTSGRLNLPNLLTLLRIFLIPFFVFFYSRPGGDILALAIFSVAALTDLLDGYLARRQSEITKLGQLLDPIADKLLIISALLLLVENGRIPAWITLLIVGREMAVTGFRVIAASEGIIMAAEQTGKYKVVFQMIALLLLLVDSPPLPSSAHTLGWGLLLLSTLLALLSAGLYFTKYGPRLNLLKD
jgi:CDP-diacylglycerol--glycerol-3-phosphate 3-phosphatidyltransferase